MVDFIIKAIKYAISGLLNTAVGFGAIFFFSNVIVLNYMVANTLGFSIGLVFSFVLQKNWVFGSNKQASKELALFLLIFFCSYLINLLTIYLVKQNFDLNLNLVQVCGMAAYAASNFLGNYFFTFKEAEGDTIS